VHPRGGAGHAEHRADGRRAESLEPRLLLTPAGTPLTAGPATRRQRTTFAFLATPSRASSVASTLFPSLTVRIVHRDGGAVQVAAWIAGRPDRANRRRELPRPGVRGSLGHAIAAERLGTCRPSAPTRRRAPSAAPSADPLYPGRGERDPSPATPQKKKEKHVAPEAVGLDEHQDHRSRHNRVAVLTTAVPRPPLADTLEVLGCAGGHVIRTRGVSRWLHLGSTTSTVIFLGLLRPESSVPAARHRPPARLAAGSVTRYGSISAIPSPAPLRGHHPRR